MDRLCGEVAAGRPLLMFGAGIGLTAKCAEIGGADLIAVYSTAIYRMMGQVFAIGIFALFQCQ